jgi:hypothetical protein
MVHLKLSANVDGDVPGLTVRIHRPSATRTRHGQSVGDVCELTFIDQLDVRLTDVVARV